MVCFRTPLNTIGVYFWNQLFMVPVQTGLANLEESNEETKEGRGRGLVAHYHARIVLDRLIGRLDAQRGWRGCRVKMAELGDIFIDTKGWKDVREARMGEGGRERRRRREKKGRKTSQCVWGPGLGDTHICRITALWVDALGAWLCGGGRSAAAVGQSCTPHTVTNAVVPTSAAAVPNRSHPSLYQSIPPPPLCIYHHYHLPYCCGH